jgi:hypothetical protein
VRYLIDQGLFDPPLEIDLEEPPPCLFCGKPVHHPSMDGPLVCAWCDCGTNHDGTHWTPAQNRERWKHRRTKIAEYCDRSASKEIS